MDYIISILSIIAIISFLLHLPKFHKKINNNLQLVAEILNGITKNKSLSYEKVIEGLYKERKVLFSYSYITKFNRVSAIIIPKSIISEQKKVLLTYPKPTQNTELRGKKIRWLKMLKPEKFFENWTKDNIIELFEELSKASEIVETNGSFYKN